MKQLTLVRVSKTSEFTAGILLYKGKPICATLEEPWRFNQPNVSCIPNGYYRAERFDSPSKGKCWKIKDVFGRTYILIHIGNTLEDTEGCILVGRYYDELGGKFAVKDSAKAFAKLEMFLGEENFELIIEN